MTPNNQRWAYMIGRPTSSIHRRPHFFNICSSETTGPIKVKFHMELLWEGGTKVCSNSPGHMTKMDAMPIYGKNLKKTSSPEPKVPWPWNLVCSSEYYQVFSNDDPGFTFTNFTVRSDLVPYAFVWEKGQTMDFSGTIIVYDVKVGRYS